MLAPDLIKYGAVNSLVDVLLQNSLGTQQVALFSLGTFCAHQEFREPLNQLQFLEIIQSNFSTSDDALIQKYVKRISQVWTM